MSELCSGWGRPNIDEEAGTAWLERKLEDDKRDRETAAVFHVGEGSGTRDIFRPII